MMTLIMNPKSILQVRSTCRPGWTFQHKSARYLVDKACKEEEEEEEIHYVHTASKGL